MKPHLFRPLALLAALAGTVAARGGEFAPVIGWEDQIYPSFVISSARVKNPGWWIRTGPTPSATRAA